MRPTAIAEDCTVPVGNLVAMFHEVAKIAEKYKLLIPVLAHAGDGNLHPQILTDNRDEEEMKRVMKAIDEISIKAVELGGTLTGEHGIGIAKREILPLELGDAAMEITKNIKMAFDPLNILNPDKGRPPGVGHLEWMDGSSRNARNEGYGGPLQQMWALHGGSVPFTSRC